MPRNHNFLGERVRPLPVWFKDIPQKQIVAAWGHWAEYAGKERWVLELRFGGRVTMEQRELHKEALRASKLPERLRDFIIRELGLSPENVGGMRYPFYIYFDNAEGRF